MNLKENQNSILHGMVMVAREPDLVLRNFSGSAHVCIILAHNLTPIEDNTSVKQICNNGPE